MFPEVQRLFVLSLDGVPYTFLKEHFERGAFPYMSNLFQQGSFKPMNSTIPPVSSVAWATYMTGLNPAGHNIFGFIDRLPNPFELFIPTASQMNAKTVWEYLSEWGKRVIVINMPVTTPPRPVNGIIISGFLAPSIEKGVYPVSLAQKLKEWDYRIDIDAKLAREDRVFLLEDLQLTTQRRLEVATRFMEKEHWDLFHLHIMGTDRINHFLWKRWEAQDPYFAPAFEHYYNSIDKYIGQTLLPLLGSEKETGLIILSDHGFCLLKKEFFLNTWLKENGWLKLKAVKNGLITDMDFGTKAYSLMPGRIYLNLKGREESGSINMETEYEITLKKLKEELLIIKDMVSGNRIIDRVFLRDEIYRGAYIKQAPDMVLLPVNGYDLKGNNIEKDSLLEDSELEGMHTYDNAFIFIRDHEINKEVFSIVDVTPTLLKILGIKPYSGLDGTCLVGY